jgi:hypothetical protein
LTEAFDCARHARGRQPYSVRDDSDRPGHRAAIPGSDHRRLFNRRREIAYASGYYAAQALVRNHSPELVTQRIGEGTGEGFMFVSPLSIVALIIMVWA